MAKTTPDMIIQLNVSAPSLEIAIKALTDAIVNGSEIVIPAGSAVQITDVQAVPTTEATQTPAPTAEVAQPIQQAAPAPAAQPQPQQIATQTPAPAAPAPQVTVLTLDAICNAGAKLVEQGQMNQVIGLLGKYGVQAVNQIKPEQYDAFAADLRGLGAQI